MPPDAAVDGATGSHEQGRMQGFVASLLRHKGALVEAIDPDGVEVLAPSDVQQALGVGEFVRLGFGATLPSQAQRVGLEGDWLERFGRLLGPQGRWTRRVLSAAAREPGDPERALNRELVLDNATFRLLGVAPLDALSDAGFPCVRRLGRQARFHAAAGHQSGDRRAPRRDTRSDRAGSGGARGRSERDRSGHSNGRRAAGDLEAATACSRSSRGRYRRGSIFRSSRSCEVCATPRPRTKTGCTNTTTIFTARR